MKILFIWLDINSGHKPGVNHGLAWISAFLKAKGHNVACVQVQEYQETNSLKQTISEFAPDCIGFSLTTNQARYLKDFAQTARKVFPGPIIAGGVHPTLDPSFVIKLQEIDGVLAGPTKLAQSLC